MTSILSALHRIHPEHCAIAALWLAAVAGGVHALAMVFATA